MAEQSESSSFEERLQPWIDQAEYIIAITIIIMAWAAGWVDLIAFESFTGAIFGRYSVPTFSIIVVYSLGFILWFWLIFSLTALDKMKRFIGFIQRNPLPLIIIILTFVVILWSTIYIKYWAQLPLLQGATLVFVIVFSALILFTKATPNSPFHLWRKVVIAGLLIFLGIELVLHGLAFLGVSPVQNVRGLFEANGFVYQNQEGHTYARTNSYGWYYPRFEVDEANTNIVFTGDSFVQGLQVDYDQHMGMRLQSQIDNETTRIMPTGLIDYGMSTYLNPNLYLFIWDDLQPDEIVVFVHLANDFQVATEPSSPRPYYEINADGNVILSPADTVYSHTYEHVVFDGHQPVVLLESAFTYSFLLSSLRDTLGDYLNPPAYLLDVPPYTFLREVIPTYRVPMLIEARSDEMPFGEASFIFETDTNQRAEDSYTIALAQLSNFVAFMERQDINVRVVTIPFFPETFYETQSGNDWQSEFGGYDMLLPEERLATFAEENNVDFIATGSAMQSMTVEAIQALYFNDGTGHLTPEGHQFLADLLYRCFYAPNTSDNLDLCGA